MRIWCPEPLDDGADKAATTMAKDTLWPEFLAIIETVVNLYLGIEVLKEIQFFRNNKEFMEVLL